MREIQTRNNGRCVVAGLRFQDISEIKQNGKSSHGAANNDLTGSMERTLPLVATVILIGKQLYALDRIAYKARRYDVGN